MIRKAHQVETFLKKPDPAVRLALIYGTDKGAIRTHARRLSAHICGAKSDPMQCVSLSESDLAQDPARLYDEAAAIPMFGGNKVIELQLTSDTQTPLIESYLAQAIDTAFIIIEAGSLRPTSKLRQLVEAADNAVTLPCFEDDMANIQRVAQTYLTQEGFAIEAAALDRLAAQLGSDRGVTMSELNRLVLYMGPRGSTQRGDKEKILITVDDIDAILGDNAAIHLHKFIDETLTGNLEQADIEFNRLLTQNQNIHSFLIGLRLHFQSLDIALNQIKQGVARTDALNKAFRPPLHFKRKPAVERQVQIWSPPKIERALHLIHEAEIDCRQTGAPAHAIVPHLILRLARAAHR